MPDLAEFEIHTLKYNYRASEIIKALQSMGFIIYRDQSDRPNPTNGIRWIFSPDRDQGRSYRLLKQSIKDLISGRDDMAWETYLWPEPLGYFKILELVVIGNIDLRDMDLWLKV